MRFRPACVLLLPIALVGCNAGPKEARPEPSPPTTATTAPAAPAAPDATTRLGAPIDPAAERVALADVAKEPSRFVGKTFTTSGTVTAVCQHMGCWMEIKDDASEAHIKMAGHAFFVPKSAAGRKARVQATLVQKEGAVECEGQGHDKAHGQGKGCRAEAEAQLGRPLAKLELVAQGVELL
jgi:hypothetical protein